jgi:hypothetical protein
MIHREQARSFVKRRTHSFRGCASSGRGIGRSRNDPLTPKIREHPEKHFLGVHQVVESASWACVISALTRSTLISFRKASYRGDRISLLIRRSVVETQSCYCKLRNIRFSTIKGVKHLTTRSHTATNGVASLTTRKEDLPNG